ncbi:MAG: flagellin [Planctomycetota bacterium]
MTRINTNVPSLIAQRVLRQNTGDLNTALERLSTGLRINRGKDDPAGLIASQNLRKDIAGTTAAISNAERADQVVNIAEGGLQEISDLLTELQSLLTQTANEAGLSREEKEANQLQVDSILQTIDRLAASTSFQGSKLLNGNFDYNADQISGVVSSFQVRGAKLQFNETRDVEILVTASAQLGGFVLSLGAASIDLNAADGSSEQFILEIAGNEGSRQVTFNSGAERDNIVTTINTFTDVTGVRAVASGASAVRLVSTEFGTDQFVSVQVVDDGNIQGGANIGIYSLSNGDTDVVGQAGGAQTAFSSVPAANGLIDFGRDVEATINGIRAVSRGTEVSINTDFLDVVVDLNYDATQPSAANVGAISAFRITGGGADFQLDGQVDIAGKVSIGIENVATRNLGRQLLDTVGGAPGSQTFYFLSDLASGKELNIADGDDTKAQIVLEEAINQVSALRGRLGAFQQNVIGATIRSLGIALENTSAAESSIRDADFAAETAELTRAQILTQSANSTLLQANTAPQAALQLLG